MIKTIFKSPCPFRVILFFFLISFNRLFAQYPSDSTEFYLLTASPGEEMYAAFGHSALRMCNTAQKFDIVFNYGIFNFETPNFYPKFVTGKLLYSLAIQDYSRFIRSYQLDGQAMYLQKINLSNKEKWKLTSILQNNYLPENRYYRYDFLHDNCSTRIRDVLKKSVDGEIIYDSSSVNNHESFRHFLTSNLKHEPWVSLGYDFLLGKSSDSIASITATMFLPVNLMSLFSTAVIKAGDSTHYLAQQPIALFPGTITFPKPNPYFSPNLLFHLLFLFVLLFSYIGFKHKRHIKWFDFLLFTIFGILGFLLLFLQMESLHRVMANNYNIVWANPLLIVLVIILFFKKKQIWMRYAYLIYSLILILFIFASFFFTQEIPVSLYPIIGILSVRSLKQFLY